MTTQTPDVADLFLHRKLKSLEACHDSVLFEVHYARESSDDSTTELWLQGPDGLQCLTDPDRPASGARWCSCGTRLAFLRSQDERQQVHVMDRAGGEARCLTATDLQIMSIEHWKAGRKGAGKILVLAYPDVDQSAPQVIQHLPFKLDGSGIVAGRRVGLYEVDDESGDMRLLLEAEGQVSEARWASCGTRLACVLGRGGAQRHASDLWLREADGTRVRLSHELESISGISWSPDGRRIAISASATEGSSVNGLYVIDVERRSVDRLGDLELATPASVQWNEDSDRLLVLEDFRGLARVSAVSLEGEVRPLVSGPACQVTAMAAAGPWIHYVAEGPDRGPELWRAGACGEDPHCLSAFNAWRRQRMPLACERRSFQVPDGNGGEETIEGWLLSPPGKGPFPLLLDMHGGPQSHVLFDFPTHLHWPVLVARGWAILALDAAGTGSYGAEFARRLRGRWGELDLPQWEAATRQLQDQGLVDGQVASFGHSYGGFLSAWALTHGLVTAGGVVSAGVLDQVSHTGTSDTGYYVGPYAMDAELMDDMDRYRALSPLTDCTEVHCPVLILQGTDDERCPRGQSEQFFSTLVRLQKPDVTLVLFPGGSHHVSSTGRPSHRKAYFDHLVEWLEKHVEHARQEPATASPSRAEHARNDERETVEE